MEDETKIEELTNVRCSAPECKKVFGTETPGELHWVGSILGESGTANGTRLKVYGANHPEPMMFCHIGCAIETLKIVEKNTEIWLDNTQGNVEDDCSFSHAGRVDWVDDFSNTHKTEYAPMPNHPRADLRNIPIIHTRVEQAKVLCEPDAEWLEQRRERAAEEASTPIRRINGSFPEDEMARAYQPMMKDIEKALNRWFLSQAA